MNQFLSRNDAVSVVPPTAPSVSPVTRVQPAMAAGNDRDDLSKSLSQKVAVPVSATSDEVTLSSASEFARAHQKIAALLADMKSDQSAEGLVKAETEINKLVPKPTVIIPLPPASPEQMERAIELAKALRADAMLARAAQAHVQSGAVEAIFS